MCLGIPVKIVSIEGDMAVVTVEGVEYKASIQLLPDAMVDDYVMLHAGFVIEKIDQEEAELTLKLLNQVADNSHQ